MQGIFKMMRLNFSIAETIKIKTIKMTAGMKIN
jgi:hypothetical protein